MSIKNLRIHDGISNGPLIKIIGNYNEILLEDSRINNIVSYGSIISNESEKSKVTISNLNFIDNSNTSKLDCSGIYFSNDLNISIKNSKFLNNNSKSNGGAICFDKISNLELNLLTNEFINNKAINGGAIYIKNGNITNMNENNSITIEDNTFSDNRADNFGGALYSEFQKMYLAKAINNNFSYNKAGILGGGIFSPNSISENLFNIEDCTFLNNTVNSYINNYTSKPAYILMKPEFSDNLIQIISGAYLNLNFTLYDEFDNLIEDITKYYSSMTLKVVLEEQKNVNKSNIKNDLNNLNYQLVGNVGSFIQGRCELNNLRIFANPNKYNIKFKIENYNDNIYIYSKQA